MRVIALAAAAITISALPAMASQDPVGGELKQHEGSMSRTGRSPGAPVDRGPSTAEANRAFMGGGMVLEGAPGASAPDPQAVPESAEREVQRLRERMEGEPKR
ncbi:hypothetical protein [Roseomonas xinghualingensis]|uniref:hypothetical protein n=1 Tax=Roseomonas xinghualingensis TaxID=2986475 RepID=UPI0021F1D817|nr:hypothetical protein [Roseomonas sp. SXEYE001]MCV4207962.1 hypothetical protein [Roseomonas sp. SXEYE001]